MLKKILPYATMSLSAVLLVTAVVDALSDAVHLFDTVPFMLALVVMLLLSLGITLLSCIAEEFREPLILVACLLQTPIGGGMAVLLVYNLCFPGKFALASLLPYLMILASLASVIQAICFWLCSGMETEEEPAAADPAPADSPTASEEEAPAEEQKIAEQPAEAPASAAAAPARSAPAPTAPAPAPAPIPKAHPKPQKKVSGQDVVAAKMAAMAHRKAMEEDEDDLAPITRKKDRKAEPEARKAPAAKEPTPAPAPAPAPAQPKAPVTYTDPFSLLTMEVPAADQTEEKEPAPAKAAVPVAPAPAEPVIKPIASEDRNAFDMEAELARLTAPAKMTKPAVSDPDADFFALTFEKRAEEPVADMNLSFDPHMNGETK